MKRNPYRSIMAGHAKTEGICTQCFARPADTPHVQCASCNETNRRKNRAKTLKRQELRDVARVTGVCTRCLKVPSRTGYRLCKACGKATSKKPTKPIPTTAKPIGRNKSREYNKKYRHKKLVDKVRKLDMIKYAVLHDKEL